MKRTAIINGRVVTPYRVFEGATVLFEDGKIVDIVRGAETQIFLSGDATRIYTGTLE